MIKTLESACYIKTGKLNANAAVKDGIYPFFTCAEYPDEIDHYAFDDDVVLVAGNNARGNFHVNRYEGRFNAYQRTYILTTKAGYSIDFIYYALKLELKRLREKAQGSQTKFLTMPILTSISLRDITYDAQCKIANTLVAIDKKIELNNQTNAELEAMAKTLYDYWFVQFDFPDADGKPYKSSGGKMVYNELLKREIPEGWGDCSLGDITELYQPQTISEKEMLDEGRYLVYGANGIVGRYDQYNHEESVVTITCRGNSCGTINFTRPFSWITGNAMVVKPKSVLLVPDYILNLLSSSGVDNVITGSAQPQITRTNLSPLSVINPNQEMLKKYASIATNLFEKRICILEENEMLAKLRDWLLPMLMNGQVTVN